MVAAFADSGTLLCYEGLAGVEAFWGKEARARQLFQEGSSRLEGTSRFYRGYAQFEKKHGDLEVLPPCVLCQSLCRRL